MLKAGDLLKLDNVFRAGLGIDTRKSKEMIDIDGSLK